MVQRRLLSRYRDRTPAAMGGLDVLLHDAHAQCVESIGAIETGQGQLAATQDALGAALRLLCLLLALRFGMSAHGEAVLRSHLGVVVRDTTEQGWEETTDSALSHLLRTKLGGAGDGDTSLVQAAARAVAAPLTMPPDTVKVHKRIALLCERLSKGYKLEATPLPVAGVRATGGKTIAASGAGGM